MITGPEAVAALKSCGVTHVLWIPDTALGEWEPALSGPDGIPLIRVCREGEAFGIAAGLIMGGKKPVILLQCTGLFEAGDTLRNVIHDMHLPIFMVVGVRSYFAYRDTTTMDTCPIYTEPIMRAWQIPYVVLDERHTAADLASAYNQIQAEKRAGAVLLAE